MRRARQGRGGSNGAWTGPDYYGSSAWLLVVAVAVMRFVGRCCHGCYDSWYAIRFAFDWLYGCCVYQTQVRPL